VSKSTFQDYADDGIKKVNQCNPDGGGDKYIENTFWDLNRGISNAGFEYQAGGDIALSDNKFLGSAYGILFNLNWGPTGTARITGNSIEESRTARIQVQQAISGVEYGNISIVGNQFSNIAQTNATLLTIAAGTPTTAPKWVRNIDVVGNHSNDMVTAGAPMLQILDGDNIIVVGNALNNNATSGPAALQISNATNVTCGPNQFTGFTSGIFSSTMVAGLVCRISYSGTPEEFVQGANNVFTNYNDGSHNLQLGVDASGNYYVNVSAGGGVSIGRLGAGQVKVDSSGNVILPSLPTSCTGKPTGTVWNNSGALGAVRNSTAAGGRR
jgi:hypothetical protein